MSRRLLFTACLLAPLFPLAAPSAWAQDAIYRCGNEYTNNATDARARGCTLVQGGNVTVVSPPKVSVQRPPPNAPRAAAGNAPPPDQQRRDSEARAILEGELKRSEARRADLQREYNNGEPERLGSEARNYQKYLDRVADLKAALARNDEDIAGIKRELSRLPGR